MAALVELRDRLRRRPGMADLSEQEADDLLAEAAEMVHDYCGWRVWPRLVETVTVDAVGGAVAGLPTMMLHEVSSVETRPPAATGPDAWEPVAGGWDWSEGGWLYRCGRWPDGPRRLRVVMESGYMEPPGAVGSVMLGIAARVRTAPVGVSSEQAGGESVSYGTSGASTDSGAGGQLTEAERRVLDRYRLENRP
ncbi:hypothetical protein ACH4GG_27215 [Streptomyces albidoflavus]|uniref:hypothetical protein n=1 Tax=Streptomyces albidoflavus TaxID=1886 RepID=UPI000A40B587|nr:hypothetical protein [Streptomyces albidoflavus]RZE18410.1 hypothetical protein C0Q96_28955 [Streptomyces albidoflavus]